MRFILLFCFILFFLASVLANAIEYIPQESAVGENVSIFVSEKINPLQEQKALIVVDAFKDLEKAKLKVFSKKENLPSIEITLTDSKENGAVVNNLQKGKQYFAWWNGFNSNLPLEEGDYFLKVVDAQGNVLPETAIIKIDWELNEPEFSRRELRNMPYIKYFYYDQDYEKSIQVNLFKGKKVAELKRILIPPLKKISELSEFETSDIEIFGVEIKEMDPKVAKNISSSVEKTYKYYPNKFRKKELFEEVSNEEKNVIKKLEFLSDFWEAETFIKRSKTSFEAILTAEEKDVLNKKLIPKGIVYLGEPYILTVKADLTGVVDEETEYKGKGQLFFNADFLGDFNRTINVMYCPIDINEVRLDEESTLTKCDIKKNDLFKISYSKTTLLKSENGQVYVEAELYLKHVPNTVRYEFYLDTNWQKPLEVRNSNLAKDAAANNVNVRIKVKVPVTIYPRDEEFGLSLSLNYVCIKAILQDGTIEHGCDPLSLPLSAQSLDPAQSFLSIQNQKIKVAVESKIKLDEVVGFLSDCITKGLEDLNTFEEKKSAIMDAKKKVIYHGYLGNTYFKELNVTLPAIFYGKELYLVTKPSDEKYEEQHYARDLSNNLNIFEQLTIPKETDKFFVEKSLNKLNGEWVEKYRPRYLLDISFYPKIFHYFYYSSRIEFLLDGVTVIDSYQTNLFNKNSSRIKNFALPIAEDLLNKEHELCLSLYAATTGESFKYCKTFRVKQYNLSQEELREIYEKQRKEWGCGQIKTNNATQDLNIVIALQDLFDEDESDEEFNGIIQKILYDKTISFSETIPLKEFFPRTAFWKMKVDIYLPEVTDETNEILMKEYCPISMQNKIVVLDAEGIGHADSENKIAFLPLFLPSTFCDLGEIEFNNVAIHEIGHSLCDLSDEYMRMWGGYEKTSNKITKTVTKEEHIKEILGEGNCFGSKKACENSYMKLVPAKERGKKPWCFEGCSYTELFRQWENSIMKDDHKPPYKFNPIGEHLCRKRIKEAMGKK